MAAEPYPFDLIERGFRDLCAERRSLSMPGSLLGPNDAGRTIPLLEIRAALLRSGTGHEARNRVLAELVRRARGGEPWRTIAAGVLLPGVRAVMGPLLRSCPQHKADLQAEALTGLFEALRTTRLDRERIAMHLVWAARRSADRLLDHELTEADPPGASDRLRWTKPLPADGRDEVTRCDATHLVWPLVPAMSGHPELVLVEACEAGVLSAEEVDLIRETRLERVSVRLYAELLGEPHNSLRMRRYRAEQQLAKWVADEKPPCKTAQKPCFRRCGTSKPEPAGESTGHGRHVDT